MFHLILSHSRYLYVAQSFVPISSSNQHSSWPLSLLKLPICPLHALSAHYKNVLGLDAHLIKYFVSAIVFFIISLAS